MKTFGVPISAHENFTLRKGRQEYRYGANHLCHGRHSRSITRFKRYRAVYDRLVTLVVVVMGRRPKMQHPAKVNARRKHHYQSNNRKGKPAPTFCIILYFRSDYCPVGLYHIRKGYSSGDLACAFDQKITCYSPRLQLDPNFRDDKLTSLQCLTAHCPMNNSWRSPSRTVPGLPVAFQHVPGERTLPRPKRSGWWYPPSPTASTLPTASWVVCGCYSPVGPPCGRGSWSDR